MMQLGVNGELAILETLYQVCFPERAAAIELPLMKMCLFIVR